MRDVAATLLSGGVALLPTDTVYGLVACPALPAAVQKIFALKARSADKKLPILVNSAKQIEGLGVALTPEIKSLLASKFVPGPLTLIVPLTGQHPSWLEGRNEVAVRIPADDFLLELLAKTGPLVATSANRSGENTPANTSDILNQLAGKPDIVRDDGPRQSQPSTLIDCQTSPFTLIRQGALSAKDIHEVLP